MVNVELLRKVQRQINEHPEVWDQEHWATHVVDVGQPYHEPTPESNCGTAFCVAGWACVLSGLWPKFNRVNHECHEDGKDYIYTSKLTNGRFIDKQAKELLGINDARAEQLFRWTNTLEDVNYMINELCEEGQ